MNKPRRKVALIALFAVMTAGAVVMLALKLRRQPLFLDYLVMWTGGRFAHVDVTEIYNFVRIDRAQAWLLGARAHDRPFPYPPSALLVFEPLARLSFWMSAWTWTLSGAALFAAGTWSLARRRRPLAVVALTFVAPGVVWAALSGQCAFVVGSLAMLAMTTLHRRPIAAGLALGLALMLKPTLLMMAPVALICGGHWRALIAIGAACGVILVGSIILHGIGPWVAWLTIAPHYLAGIASDPRYRTAIIAPTGLAIRLGVAGWPLAVFRGGFALLGALLAAGVFRLRQADPALRLVAIIGGSLLATPYAMNYETALLAPAAALALMAADTSRRSWTAVSAYGALALAGLPDVGAFAFPVGLILLVSFWVNLRRP